MEGEDNRFDLFLMIGLQEHLARNILDDNNLSANLTAVINEAALTNGCDTRTGNLMYRVATTFPDNAMVHRPTLLNYIVTSKIRNLAQLEAAFTFFMAIGSDNFKMHDFEKACGVGVVDTNPGIRRTITKVLEEYKSMTVDKPSYFTRAKLFADVRKKHPWTDTNKMKVVIEDYLADLHGERKDRRRW